MYIDFYTLNVYSLTVICIKCILRLLCWCYNNHLVDNARCLLYFRKEASEMEQEIIFLNFEQIYSKKKDEFFYIVRYMIGDDVRQDFVPKEVYDKIKDKKPVKLNHYKGKISEIIILLRLINKIPL